MTNYLPNKIFMI